MTESKKYWTQEKSLKAWDNPEYDPECNIIIEGKSYTFENPQTTFIINENLIFNSKT